MLITLYNARKKQLILYTNIYSYEKHTMSKSFALLLNVKYSTAHYYKLEKSASFYDA